MAGLRKRDMRLEPVDRSQRQAIGDGPTLGVVGHQVQPLAIANLVEPQMVREAIIHLKLPLLDSGNRRGLEFRPQAIERLRGMIERIA